VYDVPLTPASPTVSCGLVRGIVPTAKYIYVLLCITRLRGHALDSPQAPWLSYARTFDPSLTRRYLGKPSLIYEQ
jgi:hypothetical protein